MLAIHLISPFKISRTQHVVIDILRILVLVVIDFLFSFLTNRDRIPHAQNLPELRRLVLYSLQIERELSTLSLSTLILFSNRVIMSPLNFSNLSHSLLGVLGRRKLRRSLLNCLSFAISLLSVDIRRARLRVRQLNISVLLLLVFLIEDLATGRLILSIFFVLSLASLEILIAIVMLSHFLLPPTSSISIDLICFPLALVAFEFA